MKFCIVTLVSIIPSLEQGDWYSVLNLKDVPYSDPYRPVQLPQVWCKWNTVHVCLKLLWHMAAYTSMVQQARVHIRRFQGWLASVYASSRHCLDSHLHFKGNFVLSRLVDLEHLCRSSLRFSITNTHFGHGGIVPGLEATNWNPTNSRVVVVAWSEYS